MSPLKPILVSAVVFCLLFGFISAYLLAPNQAEQNGNVGRGLTMESVPLRMAGAGSEPTPLAQNIHEKEMEASESSRAKRFENVEKIQVVVQKPAAIVSILYSLMSEICRGIMKEAVRHNRFSKEVVERLEEFLTEQGDICMAFR